MSDVDNSAEDTSAADAVAESVADKSTEDKADATTEAVERPENVPEKFWDAENKTVRNDDLLKSYTELEGRFGSFTGAPDEYVAAFSDELKDKGVSLIEDDPMIESAMEFAKENGMNQEGFTNMMNLYGMNMLAQATAEKEAMEADIASLGEGSDRRLNNLSQWANKNLPEDLQEGFKDLAVSADAVKALEQVISMTRNAPVNVDDAVAAPSVTAEEVTKMQFEKDEHGGRRIQTDPEFKKRYERARDALHGTEPFREVVGGN